MDLILVEYETKLLTCVVYHISCEKYCKFLENSKEYMVVSFLENLQTSVVRQLYLLLFCKAAAGNIYNNTS